MNPSDVQNADSARPFLAGVTGGLGAGKSAVCAIIAKRHPVLFSDEISRELLATDEEVRAQVLEAFGPESYGSDGAPDRSFLAGIVFNNPEKLELLNDILHPATVVEMLRRSEELYAVGHGIVFVESALLFEAEVHVYYDCIIAVVAAEEKIFERLRAGDGITPDDARKRMAHQLPQDEKAKRADLVIRNDGTLEELERTTNMIITVVESLAKHHDAS